MRHLISTQTGGGNLPEEEKLRLLAQAGFEAIDFGFSDYAAFLYCKEKRGESIFDRSDDEVLSFFHGISNKIHAAGLTVGQAHAPFPSCFEEGEQAIVSDFHLRMFRLSLIAAREMGCPYLVCHPAFSGEAHYRQNPVAREEIWQINRRLFRELVPSARSSGVRICIENMWQWDPWPDRIVPGILSTGQELSEWIDRLNDEAGDEVFAACLDTGHALLVEQSLPEMIKVLGFRLKTLHMHDVVMNNDLHTAPFDGICNWIELAEALRSSGYEGTLNFETCNFQLRRPPELYGATADFLGKTAAWFRDLVDREM